MGAFFGGGEGSGDRIGLSENFDPRDFSPIKEIEGDTFAVTCHLSEFFGRSHVPHRLGTRVDWFLGERI